MGREAAHWRGPWGSPALGRPGAGRPLVAYSVARTEAGSRALADCASESDAACCARVARGGPAARRRAGAHTRTCCGARADCRRLFGGRRGCGPSRPERRGLFVAGAAPTQRANRALDAAGALGPDDAASARHAVRPVPAGGRRGRADHRGQRCDRPGAVAACRAAPRGPGRPAARRGLATHVLFAALPPVHRFPVAATAAAPRDGRRCAPP